MAAVSWHASTVLVTLVLVSGTSKTISESNYDTFTMDPYYLDNEEYIRQIHSVYNAYRGEMRAPLVVETDALINTKYRTWKRNVDMLNSLLSLPKGLTEAGR